MIPATGGIRSYLWPKRIDTHKHTSYSDSSFQTRIPWAQKQTDRRIQTDETESPMWSRSIESRKNLALTALKINQPLIFYYYYNLLTLLWCDSLVLRVVRLNRGVFGFTCSPSRGYGERWGWDGNETEGDRWRDDDVTHMWQDGAALLVQREKHSNHQLTHTHTPSLSRYTPWWLTGTSATCLDTIPGKIFFFKTVWIDSFPWTRNKRGQTY